METSHSWPARCPQCCLFMANYFNHNNKLPVSGICRYRCRDFFGNGKVHSGTMATGASAGQHSAATEEWLSIHFSWQQNPAIFFFCFFFSNAAVHHGGKWRLVSDLQEHWSWHLGETAIGGCSQSDSSIVCWCAEASFFRLAMRQGWLLLCHMCGFKLTWNHLSEDFCPLQSASHPMGL